uniref:Cysteine-rich and transmembrane domain-containing protein 1 n=1 Tax=Hucho hucho TaxID=62062 RepID=A0A4W5QCM3_9TELE
MSLSRNKLKRHVLTKHPQHDGKPREFFQNSVECFRKQCFDSGRADSSCCPQMNFDQPPPYGGPGPSAPGYPAPTAPGYPAPMAPVYQPQGFPDQGYPAQGYPAPGYPPTDPSYSNFPPGPPGLYQGQPGYQGYQIPPQPQLGWQDTPPGPQMYGEAPKNTVYVVEDRSRDGGGGGEHACLTACWTALCCCCLWDMMT